MADADRQWLDGIQVGELVVINEPGKKPRPVRVTEGTVGQIGVSENYFFTPFSRASGNSVDGTNKWISKPNMPDDEIAERRKMIYTLERSISTESTETLRAVVALIHQRRMGDPRS